MEPIELPLACSLNAAEMEQRAHRWRRLSERALLDSAGSAGTARLRYRPEPKVERELRELVQLERECCPFLSLTISSEDGELLLEISGPPEAESIVAGFVAGAESLSRPS
jgi:hypothetical protein